MFCGCMYLGCMWGVYGSVCASVVGGCRGGLVVVAAVVALVSAVCVCSLCWLWCRFGENEFPL